MNPWNLNLAQGGTIDVDHAEAHRKAVELCELERNRRPQMQQEAKPTAWTDRAVYAQAYNATNNAPTDGSVEGVETMRGRVFVEARSIVHSGGSGAVVVTVESSQNGVRACVEVPAGQTLTSGSLRYWLQDAITKKWGLGGVDEALASGAQRVWGTDQPIAVGAR